MTLPTLNGASSPLIWIIAVATPSLPLPDLRGFVS
jgi:hypothetical protein